jgi:hypothetical protein
MDYDKLPNKFSITSFVTPCEYRETYENSPVCALMSERAQLPIMVMATTCAKCRLDGPINEAMVNSNAVQSLIMHLNLAIFNIHKGKDYIASLISTSMRLVPRVPSILEKLDPILVSLVKYGRLTHEEMVLLVLQWIEKNDPVYDRLLEAHNQYLGLQKDLPSLLPPKPCCGQAVEVKEPSLLSKVVDAAQSAGKAVQAALDLGDKTTLEIALDRLETCRGCTATDHRGDRLYRESAVGPTCGELRAFSPLRNTRTQGCGCVLRLKAAAKENGCPLNLWKE